MYVVDMYLDIVMHTYKKVRRRRSEGEQNRNGNPTHKTLIYENKTFALSH